MSAKTNLIIDFDSTISSLESMEVMFEIALAGAPDSKQDQETHC